MFLPITVYKVLHNGKEQETGKTLVRIRIDLVEYYQDFGSKGCIVYTKTHGNFYVTESVQELDILAKGANQQITGLLYGKV